MQSNHGLSSRKDQLKDQTKVLIKVTTLPRNSYSVAQTRTLKLTPRRQTCLPLLHKVRLALGSGAGQVALIPLWKKKTLRKIPTTNINNKCNVLLQCCSEFYIIWSKQNLQDYSVTSFASLVNSVIKLKIPGMKVQLREIHGRVKWGWVRRRCSMSWLANHGDSLSYSCEINCFFF